MNGWHVIVILYLQKRLHLWHNLFVRQLIFLQQHNWKSCKRLFVMFLRKVGPWWTFDVHLNYRQDSAFFLSGMFTLLRARALWTASLHSSCSSTLHYELPSQACSLQVQVIFQLWYNLRLSELFTASINGCVKVDHQDCRTAVDPAPVSVNDVNHQRTTTADSVPASVNSALWVTFSCVLLLTFDLFCICLLYTSDAADE